MKFGKKKFLVLRENIIEGYEVFCFIVLLEGLSFFEVNIDGDVKFEVRVSGKFFFQVKWLKDDQFLLEIKNFVVCSDKDIYMLIILGFILKDKGIYVCVVLNDVGIFIRSFDVNIEGYEDWVMFFFEEYLESFFQILDDGDVIMEVKVVGNFFLDVEWAKDD